jgi:hypothetical protein
MEFRPCWLDPRGSRSPRMTRAKVSSPSGGRSPRSGPPPSRRRLALSQSARCARRCSWTTGSMCLVACSLGSSVRLEQMHRTLEPRSVRRARRGLCGGRDHAGAPWAHRPGRSADGASRGCCRPSDDRCGWLRCRAGCHGVLLHQTGSSDPGAANGHRGGRPRRAPTRHGPARGDPGLGQPAPVRSGGRSPRQPAGRSRRSTKPGRGRLDAFAGGQPRDLPNRAAVLRRR